MGISREVNAMTDEKLYEELVRLGYNPGPIVDSTRDFYKCRLAELLRPAEEHEFRLGSSSMSQETIRLRKHPGESDSDQNSENSDSEEGTKNMYGGSRIRACHPPVEPEKRMSRLVRIVLVIVVFTFIMIFLKMFYGN